MKTLFLTICIAIIFFKGQAQNKVELPLTDGKVEYSGLIKLSDTTYSKQKLFSLAQNWFASTFRDANAVVKVSDKDNGVLIGHGSVLYIPANAWKNTVNCYLYFYVEIDVKPGKYRYKIYNMTFIGSTEISISSEYNSYQSDNISVGAFESKKHAMKKFEDDFTFINKTMHQLEESLQTKMAEIKTDDF